MVLAEAAGSVLVEGAVEIIVHAAKSPLAKLVRHITGKRIIIVGPPKSGKTSFARYLRYGIPADESVNLRSTGIETHSTFSVELGKGQKLSVNFSYMRALPGQVTPSNQATNIKASKANLALVMLDLTKYKGPSQQQDDENIIGWLEEFCRHLARNYSRASEKAKGRLKLVVALNKTDKVTQTILHQARRRVSKTIADTLMEQFSDRAKGFPISPCCLIDHPALIKDRDSLMRLILAELQ
jgi:signal recognition particle receptor subunit beta